MSKLRPYIFGIFIALVASASTFAVEDHVPDSKENFNNITGTRPASGAKPRTEAAFRVLDEIRNETRRDGTSEGNKDFGVMKTGKNAADRKLAEFLIEDDRGQTKLNDETCKITGEYGVMVHNNHGPFTKSEEIVNDKEAFKDVIEPRTTGKRVFARTSFVKGIESASGCVQTWMTNFASYDDLNKRLVSEYARGNKGNDPDAAAVAIFDPMMETFCINASKVDGGVMCSIVATFPKGPEEPAKEVAADERRSPAGSPGAGAGGPAAADREPAGIPGTDPGPVPRRRQPGEQPPGGTPPGSTPDPLPGLPSGESTTPTGMFDWNQGNLETLKALKLDLQSPGVQLIAALRKDAGAIGQQFADIGKQLGIVDPETGQVLALEFDEANPSRLMDSFGNDVPQLAIEMTVQYYQTALSKQPPWLTAEEQQAIQPFMQAHARPGGGGPGGPGGGPIDPNDPRFRDFRGDGPLSPDPIIPGGGAPGDAQPGAQPGAGPRPAVQPDPNFPGVENRPVRPEARLIPVN